MANKITIVGTAIVFDFVRMDVPQYLSRKVNYTSRTGVDGFAVWDAGYRGEARSITTWADFTSYQLAWEEYQLGYLKARAKLVEIEHENTHTQHKLRAIVTDVQPFGRGIRSTVCGVGGLQGFNINGGVAQAQWTVLGLQEISA